MNQLDRLRRLFGGDVRLIKRRPIRIQLKPEVASQRRPVAPPAPRKSFYLRPRPDGVPDILDAIQEFGGIASPAQSRFADKGDYDGFAEAFRGPARLLIRRHGGMMPDQLLEGLTNAGSGMGQTFKLESTSDLYDAVSAAVKDRATGKRQFAAQRVGEEFYTHALTGDRCRLNTQMLKVGDRFKVKRDTCHVQDIDPDNFEVQVDCSPKFGRQRLPDNAPFNPAGCQLEAKENPIGFFDDPESIEAQKKRLAAEALRQAKAAQQEEIRRRQACRIVGRSVDTTGDLFDPGSADAPLFAVRKNPVDRLRAVFAH